MQDVYSKMKVSPSSYKPKHYSQMLLKLENMYGNRVGANIFWSENWDDLYKLRDEVIKWRDYQVNVAHKALIDMYAENGERASNRGRPPGAKSKRNRARSSNDWYNAPPSAPVTRPFTPPKIDIFDPVLEPEIIEPEIIEPEVKPNGANVPALIEQTAQPIQAFNLSEYLLKSEFMKAELKIHEDQNAIRRSVNELDADKKALVQEIIDIRTKFDAFKRSEPLTVEIKKPELNQNIKLGLVHKCFPDLLETAQALTHDGHHLNIWVYGPAGTGKSTGATQVAKAMELKCYVDNKLSADFQVLGHNNATGYVRTKFRDAYEFGGVYVCEEIDASQPDALIGFNAGISGDMCGFPDKIVPRHKDFIFIGGANTTGLGGTLDYVGRMKQDAAFNDRFVYIDWPIDEALEAAICDNDDWLRIVRTVRANVIKHQIKGHLVTPRATVNGCALLRQGMALDKVINMTLRKGMSEQFWRNASEGI